ncbi:MFS transporter [Variovorax fucosicus]|uniref:MFS transporter n=1 Tax=Variovorax fucosicus TaxID=3053517 RepID=UPI0025764D6B|nr:MFS transporter [Variovorax sp. J22G47]MDM0056128.1 MFS transporter [Variovorax sp. J22G47]
MSAVVERSRVPVAALAVIAAGVGVALHLGKLPPAVPALQASLGLTLVEAGFMLSLVQLAGMTLGLVVGLAADKIGLRRSMLIGLSIVTLASLLGGLVGHIGAPQVVVWLLALRALEGVGFLLTVMPAPGLIRAMAPSGAEKAAMGLWGAYMPLGVALALLCGPTVIAWAGWPGWWWALALLSAGTTLWVAAVVPPDRLRATAAAATTGWPDRLRATLGAAGPWIVSLAFAVYSAQWMAVIGFLPAIYAGAGVPSSWSAVLTALAAAMNIVGNVAGGRWLQQGAAPARLLRWGFAAMALGSLAAFAQWGQGADAIMLPAALRYAAVCVFSLAGGMVPATLFMLSVRLAPGPSTVSTTVGMMQQASALGQFLAPPLVAWIAHRVGGWHWTWVVALACSLAGIALASRLSTASRGALA